MAAVIADEKNYDPLYATQSMGDEEDQVQSGKSIDKQSLIRSGSIEQKHPGVETVPLRDGTYQQETIFGFDGLKVIVVSAIIFALAILIALIVTILIGDPQVQPHGAVSSSAQQCSDVGKNMLANKGGSAVDAALATSICMGVVNAQLSGLGGGGFMLVGEYVKSTGETVKRNYTIVAYDYRETAPEDSTPDMFKNNPQAAKKGGLSVAVPGELQGIARAHEQYGKVSWEDLFEPSINLARYGFKCTGNLAEHLAKMSLEEMSPRFKEVYAPGGVKVKEGDTVKRPKLAKLLERIAESREEGVKLFYTGDIANEIVQAVQASQGIMKASDLANYKAQSVTPISIDYQGYQITSLPAPSGGPFVLSAMKILEGYMKKNMTKDTLYYHRLVETFKFVSAMGSNLGDQLFVPNVYNVTLDMLSKNKTDDIRTWITDATTHNSSYYFEHSFGLNQPPIQSAGTAQISVIDNANNMVSLTTLNNSSTDTGSSQVEVFYQNFQISLKSTLNDGFGSGIMTESGIILNNEMRDFNWENKSATPIGSSQANYIQGGKRPQSHMAPIIAWNKTNVCARKMAIGGINGSRIWTGIAQVIINLLGFRESIEASVQPFNRLHEDFGPNKVEVEADIDQAVIQGLEAKGHTVVKVTEGLSGVNVVMKESDQLYSVADNRTAGSGKSQF